MNHHSNYIMFNSFVSFLILHLGQSNSNQHICVTGHSRFQTLLGNTAHHEYSERLTGIPPDSLMAWMVNTFKTWQIQVVRRDASNRTHCWPAQLNVPRKTSCGTQMSYPHSPRKRHPRNFRRSHFQAGWSFKNFHNRSDEHRKQQTHTPVPGFKRCRIIPGRRCRRCGTAPQKFVSQSRNVAFRQGSKAAKKPKQKQVRTGAREEGTDDSWPGSRESSGPHTSRLRVDTGSPSHNSQRPFPLSLRFQILRPKQKQPPPPFESQRKVGRVKEGEKERERDGGPTKRAAASTVRKWGLWRCTRDISPNKPAHFFFFFFFFFLFVLLSQPCQDPGIPPCSRHPPQE